MDQYENARTSVFLARPRSSRWFADDSGRELVNYVPLWRIIEDIIKIILFIDSLSNTTLIFT